MPRILVIEDDQDAFHAIAITLVIQARNGLQMVTSLRNHVFDAVLCTSELHHRSEVSHHGLDLLRALRKHLGPAVLIIGGSSTGSPWERLTLTDPNLRATLKLGGKWSARGVLAYLAKFNFG